MASCAPLLVSAPGKVILHGEHAVVYGKPALAASVDLRCYTLLVPCDAPSVTLHLPDLSVHKTWLLPELAAIPCESDRAESKLRELTGADVDIPATDAMACLTFLHLLTHICGDKLKEGGGLVVTVVATLPAGAGLGSSAAYSVSLSAALLAHTHTIQPPSQSVTPLAGPPELILTTLRECGACPGKGGVWGEREKEIINKWGFKAEHLLHGRPSGIDNSISTYGGAIHFESGTVSRLERMPKLRVLLINTKVPRSTKKMVAIVRERREKLPTVTNSIFDAIEGIVNSAMELFTNSSSHDSHVTESLQELSAINHHLLNALGAGHPSLEQACKVLSSFGLSGKLTGAGGGGCVVALLPSGFSDERVAKLRGVLHGEGCESWCTQVGTVGVCLHDSINLTP